MTDADIKPQHNLVNRAVDEDTLRLFRLKLNLQAAIATVACSETLAQHDCSDRQM